MPGNPDIEGPDTAGLLLHLHVGTDMILLAFLTCHFLAHMVAHGSGEYTILY